MFSLTGWSPRIHAEFLVFRTTQVPSRQITPFRVQGYHLLWPDFPFRSAMVFFFLYRRSFYPGRCRNTSGLGSGAFARHYLRNHYCFLFLRVMRCFSSPGLPHALHGSAIACTGLPHSEICGSICICHSPQLIAACHVLLRLRKPRHPSCALVSFPFFFSPFLNWFVLAELALAHS